jgi:two-component system phosphate regulon response regulator PhoB
MLMTNARPRILIVDDERDLVELLQYNLGKAGYDVVAAGDGKAALQAIADRPPDLILLDVMLPKLSGTEVAARVRSNPATATLPIVMLTARQEEVDELVGLTAGADDYVTKPFSVKVLLARVDAVLRRSKATPNPGTAATLGRVSLDLDTHQARVDGLPVHLTLTEFRLLAALIKAGGRVLTRDALITIGMGPGVMVTDRTIDVHVTAIRRKLGPEGHLVKTVRGVGYRAANERDEASDSGTPVPASAAGESARGRAGDESASTP